MSMNKSNVQKGYAESGGGRLYYEILGEGPDLVLLHAGIADCRMWDDQVETFADRFRVIRYDMRGFGESKTMTVPFSHRADLGNLLRHLHVERAHLLGASQGGGLALDFALDRPEAVVSLVLVAPALSGFVYEGQPPAKMMELFAARQAGDLERAVELQVELWVDGPGRAGGKADERVRERVRVMGRQALAHQAVLIKETGFLVDTPLDPPAAGRLGEIAAPVFVVYGDGDDETIGEIADRLTGGIKRARQAIIPGTAHFPNMEKPGIFNRIVSDFWTRI
jgi:pimeloyl-ACP methyl ester carboxylesterase